MDTKDRLRYVYEKGFEDLIKFTLSSFKKDDDGSVKDMRTGEIVSERAVALEFISIISNNASPKFKERTIPAINISDVFELEEMGYKLRWFNPAHCRINGCIDIHPISGKYVDLRTGKRSIVPLNITAFIPSILKNDEIFRK